MISMKYQLRVKQNCQGITKTEKVKRIGENKKNWGKEAQKYENLLDLPRAIVGTIGLNRAHDTWHDGIKT